MLAQGIAMGGLMVFGMNISWLFGREFADGVVKDMLAVPVARTRSSGQVHRGGGVVGGLAGVGGRRGADLGRHAAPAAGGAEVIAGGAGRAAVAALLTIHHHSPTAFFASVGRGYLLPIGV
jgi:ABC-2 type transport system permease protein